MSEKLSPGVIVGLSVTLFGVVMVGLVLLSNASGFPGPGTPIINPKATEAIQTQNAVYALSQPETPDPDLWTVYETPAVEVLLLVGDVVYAGTADGLFRWTLDGEPTRLSREEWQVEADGQVMVAGEPVPGLLFVDGTWQRVEDAQTAPAAWDEFCAVQNALPAADGSIWLACPETLIHADPDGQILAVYGEVQGLPALPTGPLLQDTDGRLWIGLESGVGVLGE